MSELYHNESFWLKADRPEWMLRYLSETKRSKRKLRLFACACSRRLWHFLAQEDDQTRQMVFASEQYADGQISRAQLVKHQKAAHDQTAGHHISAEEDVAQLARRGAINAAAWASSGSAKRASSSARGGLVHIVDPEDPYQIPFLYYQERQAQASLLRDIFGNPFRPVAIDPAWLKWNDATIPRLAQRIYDERRFEELPMLADALEEAGCTHADILDHCRGPGPHVRGCWVVDLLLGKE